MVVKLPNMAPLLLLEGRLALAVSTKRPRLEQLLLRLHGFGNGRRPYRRVQLGVDALVGGMHRFRLSPRGCDDHLGPFFTLGLVPREAVGHAESGTAERTS